MKDLFSKVTKNNKPTSGDSWSFNTLPWDERWKQNSESGFISYNGWFFDPKAVDQKKRELTALKEAHASVPNPASPRFNFRLDRSLSLKDLTEAIAATIESKGIDPNSLLIRVVGQPHIQTPTAGSLEDSTELAEALGFSEYTSTWANEFRSEAPFPSPSWSSKPSTQGKGITFLRKRDLHCIDRIGEKPVERRFWVFLGNPNDAIVGTVHDYGMEKLVMNKKVQSFSISFPKG